MVYQSMVHKIKIIKIVYFCCFFADDSIAESNEVTYSEVRTKVKKCKSKGVQNYEHFNFWGVNYLF